MKTQINGTDIRELLAKHLGVDISLVTDETHIVSDLGADSLDMVEIILAIENKYVINLSDDFMDNTVGYFPTVKKLIDSLQREFNEIPRPFLFDNKNDEILQILKNIGYDVTCGTCMEIAFTGSSLGHAHTCKTKNEIVMPNEVLAGLPGIEYNIVRSALNRQRLYLKSFLNYECKKESTPITYKSIEREIEVIKTMLKQKPEVDVKTFK